MVNIFIVPPAGLPNEGLRKKFNLKYWLSTRKNLHVEEHVLFISLFYFPRCLYKVSEIPVSADSGVSETLPLLR